MATLDTVDRLTLPAIIRAGRAAGNFHEPLGLDLPHLAELAGYTPQAAQAWEGGHYPPEVLSLLLELDHSMSRTAHKLVTAIQQQLLENGPLHHPLSLLVFATDADLWRFKPEFRPLPAGVHAALVQRCRSALADLRVASRAVPLHVPRYVAWLDGREDTDVLRVTWASQQP